MTGYPTHDEHSRRPVPALILVCLAVLLASCAQLPASGGQGALPYPAPSSSGALAPSAPSVTATASPTTAPTPSATPTVKPTPVDPFTLLSKKTKKEFGSCFQQTVRPKSSGHCALLVVKKLRSAGYYPWPIVSRINVAGANAILNYQRSRGLKPTATTTKETWLALAAKAHALPKVIPDTCKTKGVVLCVDQAHRTLTYLKSGKVIKTIRVRLGGYNSHPKTHKWRVFPTANGTWHVFDKQVNPKSENYGSGAMPYSTMFYPDMYVHYSPGFHAVGYAGSSHGCVNVGTLSQAIWIFRHTPIGAKVHIFSPKKV